MTVSCPCSICGGAQVPLDIKRNHDRAALKSQTVLQQRVCQPGLASMETIAGGSSISVPSCLVDSLCTSSAFMDLKSSAHLLMDLDVINSDASYNNCLISDPLEPPFNQMNNNLVEKAQEDLMCQGTYNQERFS